MEERSIIQRYSRGDRHLSQNTAGSGTSVLYGGVLCLCRGLYHRLVHHEDPCAEIQAHRCFLISGLKHHKNAPRKSMNLRGAFRLEDWASAHATGGRDGRQEGCERGYYHLHRNLNKSFLSHRS